LVSLVNSWLPEIPWLAADPPQIPGLTMENPLLWPPTTPILHGKIPTKGILTSFSI